MRILWLDQAEHDLEEIVITSSDAIPRPPRASTTLSGGAWSCSPRNQRSGGSGRVKDTRELVIARTPYIVAYTVDRHIDAVIILRVLHSARQWPDDLASVT